MKLSTRSRYGVRLMTRLAMNHAKGAVLMKDISRLEGISEKYLGQIIIPLRGAGLVTGRRGAGGGYTLNRKPSDITVRDIVEVLEGDISLVPCVGDPESCSRMGACAATDRVEEAGRRRGTGARLLHAQGPRGGGPAQGREFHGILDMSDAGAGTTAALSARLSILKREKAATVLAHVYTLPEVQDVADFVGDSLGLSRQAAALDPSIRVIVFCGVHFMAETAAMLSPDRTVLLPDAPRGLPDGRHGERRGRARAAPRAPGGGRLLRQLHGRGEGGERRLRHLIQRGADDFEQRTALEEVTQTSLSAFTAAVELT